jgi:hypothetical protein
VAWPLAPLRRLLTRAEPPAPSRRSFDAATGGRRAPSTFGRHNAEIGAASGLVSARARYLAENDPLVAQGVANLVTALVGTGIRPVPTGEPADR